MRLAFCSIAACASLSTAAALAMGAEGAPKSLRLYYGDMPFWRAEVVRLALFVGDVPFDDVRDQTRAELMAEGKLPFGAVPVLEVDGKILSQTQAIAVYCAKLAGLHPDDPWLAAKVDEALGGCTDATGTIGGTMRLPAEEKVAARQAMVAPEGRLTLHLGGLEKLAAVNGGCGHMVGTSLTVADVAVWRLAGWISSGVVDGIPADYFASTFPSLRKVCELVDAHPKVVEWKQLHPTNYS